MFDKNKFVFPNIAGGFGLRRTSALFLHTTAAAAGSGRHSVDCAGVDDHLIDVTVVPRFIFAQAQRPRSCFVKVLEQETRCVGC